jgi:Co/Zn/Cd efflux system component
MNARRRSRIGSIYGICCLVMGVAAGAILAAHPHKGPSGLPVIALIGVAGAAIGFILLQRRPDQRLGWVVAALGAISLFQCLVDTYATFTSHGSRLPFAASVFVLDEVPSGLLVSLITLLLLLFPTGRLPGPRWRWPFGMVVAVTAAGLPGRLTRPGRFEELHALSNPIGLHSALLHRATDVANVIGIPLLLLSVVSVLVRWRRADLTTRDQIKGLAVAAALWPFVIVVLVVTPSSFSNSNWGEILFALPTAAMLVAVAVAVLRYRLYDMDRVISRTLSYAAVTGLLVAMYLGCVALSTRALPFSSSVGVAASTLAVAALFNPLRRRVQSGVDHRFNRARYDAGRTVDAFALRLRDEVDPELVRTDLLSVTAHSVQPATISLWVR